MDVDIEDFLEEKSIAESHDGQRCSIDLVVNNGHFDRNYYDVVFEDGERLNAISSYHLKKLWPYA